MNTLIRVFNIFKAVYYLLRLAIIPKRSLKALLKLGNMLSETKAFGEAAATVLKDDEARALTQRRYGPGIPKTADLLLMPEGSLGYVLGKFMDDQGLDQYPYLIKKSYTEQAYLRERRRQLHDVLHVLLKYDTSLEGEAKVNAFICGQSAFPIPVIISSGVLLISLFKRSMNTSQIYRNQFKAYQLGKQSASIFGIKWEEYLGQPIEIARNRLLNNAFKRKNWIGRFRLVRC